MRLSKNNQVIYLDECVKYYCRVEFEGKRGWAKAIPKNLQSQLPTIEDLERELEDIDIQDTDSE